MKNILKSLTPMATLMAVLFNFIIGALLGFILQVSPIMLGVAFILAGIVLGEARLYFAKKGKRFLPGNIAFAGLLKEIWISALMEVYYANYTFLTRSQDMSMFVENNTINLADCGVDPNVLVNNTVYPVPVSERADSPLELPLDYFDSENTVVRNAEAVQLAYPKLESVVKQHRNAIQLKCAKKASYSFGPTSDSTYTPVLSTSGAARGDGSNKLTLQDVSQLQTKFDNINAPEEGRILVLSPKHRQDLLNEDKVLFKMFADLKAGQVLPLFGFDVYWSQLTPIYNHTTGVKAAFGAAAAGTDAVSSIAYLESEVMRADGTLDMFQRLKDPEQRGDIVGFQKRFLAMPIRNKYFAAIYDSASA
jgi:hypothetical protein